MDHGNILLDKSDYRKFQIEARRSSNGEYRVRQDRPFLLKRPQVFIICMNATQIKNMIGTDKKNNGYSNAGALAGYITIMMGKKQHKYPPKCNAGPRPSMQASTGRSRASTSSSTRTTSTARAPAP